MRIKLRLWEPEKPDFEPKPAGFLISLTLHIAGIFGLVAAGPLGLAPAPPVHREMETPVRKKLILLEPRLPKVSPPDIAQVAPVSRAMNPTPLQAVLTDPQKAPVKQFVLNPSPPPEIKPPPPSPDMIKVPGAMPEMPAPPPKPVPKEFVPPPARAAAAGRAIAMPSEAPVVVAQAPDPRRPPRAAMPAAGAPPPSEIKMPDTPPPPVAAAGNSAEPALAILNASPSPTAAPPVPPAARAGQVARGAEAGAPAIRKSEEAGLRLPGVAVERPPVPAMAPPGPPNVPPPVPEIRYRLSQLGAMQNSISVPLRPFARQVSRDIEITFTGRNVYSMIVPMAGMDSYRGDWAMWFGERDQSAADGPVSAPLPSAKRVMPKGAPAPLRESKVRARFIIGADGTVSSVSIPFCSDNSLEARAAEDLKLWRFRPATKNGLPFKADVVLEYWFRVNSE